MVVLHVVNATTAPGSYQRYSDKHQKHRQHYDMYVLYLIHSNKNGQTENKGPQHQQSPNEQPGKTNLGAQLWLTLPVYLPSVQHLLRRAWCRRYFDDKVLSMSKHAQYVPSRL